MDIQVKGTKIKCSITRILLLDTWLSIKDSNSDSDRSRQVCQTLLQSLPDVENMNTNDLQNRISNLCVRFAKYWKQVQRSYSRIVTKYSEWLNESEVFTLSTAAAHNTQQLAAPDLPSTSGLQYRKDFKDCSKRSKRRRLAELTKVDESAINSLLSDSNQSNTSFSFVEFKTDEVLSLITESKLTKHQYLLLKEFINAKFPNALPSYQKVLEAKKRCYPPQECITESSAEIELQSLLDHTTSRILESQKEVLKTIDISKEFVLIGKWGFDGSTGHSEYKQKFSDSSIEDDSLFVTSYCPLQLICKSNTSDPDQIVWKNPRPSSTRFCRPIRFQFAKETKALSVQEETYFKNKISNLQPSSFIFNCCEIKVLHNLQLTMVDGKICGALSDTSCSRCYICGATPKEMNNIEKSLSKSLDSSKYQFGLSPLHSWIRFFEYFIHISYRLDFNKWQARSTEDKALLAQKKKYVQQQFRERLGLIVDKPRSGGSGTSNDGNTARTFFLNSDISAEITGLEKTLINRCNHILQCLSSGYKINSLAFKEYALETARMLVAAYPWYNLPSSVHKVLIHGSEVIEHSLLSIGELSEEAAESCNKLIKQFRRDNTRKMSRVVTNTDLMHRLLLNSDPYMSSLRKLPRKKNSVLSAEVLNLIIIEK